MKATGYVRKLDELGRVVLPKRIRKDAGILEGTDYEVLIFEECIGIRKYNPPCIFCSSIENVSTVKGKKICSTCIEEIRKL